MRSRLAAVLISMLLASVSSAQEPTVDNPEIFAKSLEAARQAMEFYGAYDNPAELRRVADIGYRIAQETRFSGYPFSFFLVDIPVPNAFALPAGQIFITRGMLDLGLTDDMLGGLLGHEIGHVVMNHGLRMQRRATLLNVLSQTLLAGVIIATHNDRDDYLPPTGGYDPSNPRGDRVMGTAAAGVVVSELLLRSYSREFEDEADSEGQRWAAAAGFDPNGYRNLMELMRTRLPESKEYGYWRTHPFFDSRVKAALVRADLLTVQEGRPTDDLRRATQERLLRLVDLPKLEASARKLLEDAAVTAWPLGPEANRIRLARLHAMRDEELEKNLLARDFGRLLEVYEKTYEEVASLNPEAEILATLNSEMEGFRSDIADALPKALETLEGGVYQTGFLETFISNHPDSPALPEVALELGDAYARLRRPEDAARMYLRAATSAPDSDAGRRARAGLRTLTPTIPSLSLLQQLSDESDDSELSDLAGTHLEKRIASFTELSNGSRFLKDHPSSPHAEAVTARIDEIAEGLLGEATLYQRVGDHAKALERINRILTQAPYSRAADKLRKDAILES